VFCILLLSTVVFKRGGPLQISDGGSPSFTCEKENSYGVLNKCNPKNCQLWPPVFDFEPWKKKLNYDGMYED